MYQLGGALAAALTSRDALEAELHAMRAAAERARPPLPPAPAAGGTLQRLAAARAGLATPPTAAPGGFAGGAAAPLLPRLPSYALQQQQQGPGAGQPSAAAGYGALPSAFALPWPGPMGNGGTRQVSPAVASTTVSSELAG